jgi:hypothetical protein
MEQGRKRVLLSTVDDVPEADTISIVETDPHPAPLLVHKFSRLIAASMRYVLCEDD